MTAGLLESAAAGLGPLLYAAVPVLLVLGLGVVVGRIYRGLHK